MKRILSFMIFFLLLLPISFVQAVTPAPKLIISTILIELGKIKQSQVLERVLAIQNIGNMDLVISSISIDCPCTSFQALDKDGKYQPLQQDSKITIAPGEKIDLKLIFDSNKTKYQGEFKKLIVISSNDPEAPMKRLEMLGEIEVLLPETGR